MIPRGRNDIHVAQVYHRVGIGGSDGDRRPSGEGHALWTGREQRRCRPGHRRSIERRAVNIQVAIGVGRAVIKVVEEVHRQRVRTGRETTLHRGRIVLA
jgi:hypothetical protein